MCDVRGRDGRFGSKVGQIGPKWDKFGASSDQISMHLAHGPNLSILRYVGISESLVHFLLVVLSLHFVC